MILLFRGAGKDTIPIYIPAARPRIGTIGKNHIPSSFIFCIKLFSFSALNLILSLRIISQKSQRILNCHKKVRKSIFKDTVRKIEKLWFSLFLKRGNLENAFDFTLTVTFQSV